MRPGRFGCPAGGRAATGGSSSEPGRRSSFFRAATAAGHRTRLLDRSKEVIEDTVGAESPAARAIASSVDSHLRSDVAKDAAEPQARRGRGDEVDDSVYDPSTDFRR
ncbi:MAG: hypothetical protein ABIQ18_24570 [Umezawaea sp.]